MDFFALLSNFLKEGMRQGANKEALLTKFSTLAAIELLTSSKNKRKSSNKFSYFISRSLVCQNNKNSLTEQK